MALFFGTHQCTEICEKLNLKKFDLSEEEKKRIENTGPKLSSSTELKPDTFSQSFWYLSKYCCIQFIYHSIYTYIYMHTYIHSSMHTYMYTDRHTDRQTHRQTDTHTHTNACIFRSAFFNLILIKNNQYF